MYNFKKGLSVVLIAGLAAALAACGSGSGSSGSDGAASNGGASSSTGGAAVTPNAEKVKLSFWYNSRHDSQFIEEKIAHFNETNEGNIEVELTVMAENYNQSLDLAFSSNQAPDVFEKPVRDMYEKGYIEPLNDYLDEDMKQKFSSAFVEGTSMFEGNIISLANYANTIRLVYNVDLFEAVGLKAPKSLDDMVEAAKKITEYGKDKGIYGWAMNYKNPSSSLGRSLSAIAQINGYPGGYHYATARFDFGPWKPIAEAFRQMYADGSTIPGAESLDIDPLRAQFAEGNIGMYISYSFEPGVYQNQFPAKIRWAAAQVPTIDGGEPKGVIGVGGTTWLALSSESKNKEAAWEFMKYMYGEELLVEYHEQGLGLSILPHVLAKAGDPVIPGMEYFIPTKYDGNYPIQPRYSIEGKSIWDELMTYILVGGDLDKILAETTVRYNQALDRSIADGNQVEPIPDFDSRNYQVEK